MNLDAMQKLSYGLYAICSKKEGKMNGQIANAIFQVTSDPPLIAASINKKNCTHEYIKSSKTFTISILSEETPMNFIGTFGFKCGREIDKFEGVKFILGKNGVPIITDYSIAYIEINLLKTIDVGTHSIFIGKVINSKVLSDKTPMTYKYYHEIKGGYAPKTAPTYNKKNNEFKNEKTKMEEEKMDKYVCDVCGYVYDPQKGDPDNGIEAGTSFEDLPEDWVCPICGAPKSEFSKEE